MNTHGLTRQRLRKQAPRPLADVNEAQDKQDQQYPKTMTATAETGDPTRSFKMLFQYEEAARYRSQELHDQAERRRLLRDARELRRQSETHARRARRTLAGLFLS